MEDVLVLADAPRCDATTTTTTTTTDRLRQRLWSLSGRLVSALPLSTAEERAARRFRRVKDEQRRQLRQRMNSAETFAEWEEAARRLEELTEPLPPDTDDSYAARVVAARTAELEAARASGDVGRMVHAVRTALSREVGVGGARAARYVAASVAVVDALGASDAAAAAGLLAAVQLARTSYGRTALVLSGGSVFGMAHIGVLKALFEQQLLPRIVSGTSAGSIVAAVVCSRTDEELPALLHVFAHGDLAVFTDAAHPDSWWTHAARVVRQGAWHDSRHLVRVMRGLVGDMTFREAFFRTRRVLNITVSSRPGLQLPPLLNHLTAPDVLVWSAVVASCSVPGVFDARPLLVRDPDAGGPVPWDPAEQLWLDGSLDHDVPVERLAELLNVNHVIVSQANPHIVRFLTPASAASASSASASSPSSASPASPRNTLVALAYAETVYTLEALADLGVCRDGLRMVLQMLRQTYTADINILPRMSLLAWGAHLIRNPTTTFMLEACRVGEQATWPSLARIREACAVERALDRAVYRLRERIALGDGPRRSVPRSLNRLRRSGSDVLVMTGVGADDCADADCYPSIHHRRARRGSGGSIQMSARRRRTRHDLETTLCDDDGGGAQPAGSGILPASSGILRGPGLPVRQSSLSQLPMPMRTHTPTPTSALTPAASFVRQTYGMVLTRPSGIFSRVPSSNGDDTAGLRMRSARQADIVGDDDDYASSFETDPEEGPYR